MGNSGELVINPEFSPAQDGTARGWRIWRPVWAKASCRVRATDEGLVIRAPDDNPLAVGGVEQELRGVRGGEFYAVEACGEARDIPSPYRSILMRLIWTRKGEAIHPAGVLIRGPFVEGRKFEFNDLIAAPEEADGAILSLEVRWLQGGAAIWKRVSVRPADPPKPRRVRVGTVYLRPQGSTPERNLELFCELIDEAGKLKLDIVCLPEMLTVVGTGLSPTDCAEPIPGPSTRKLGEAARRNRIWVVAGLVELDGDLIYNTAVLIDREGRLAGKYRKVHLPREEWKKGIAPGDEYPVFRTDFGTIAIQICYDWFFPEVAAIFALKGAEIIFAPTWGNTLPDRDGRVEGETTFRVRARDNGVYMVPSVYDGNSLIIDPMGRVLASSEGREGVFWAEIDLNLREPLPWVGHWRSIGPRDRMPQTYGPLLEEPMQPNY